MFDWFKEVVMELNGIDSNAARKARMEKREQKKLDYFIFSPVMKALTIVLGVVYIIMAIGVISAVKNMALDSVGIIIRYVLMSIIAIVVIFSLIFGKKKGEIVALVGAFIFVVGMFLSTALM